MLEQGAAARRVGPDQDVFHFADTGCAYCAFFLMGHASSLYLPCVDDGGFFRPAVEAFCGIRRIGRRFRADESRDNPQVLTAILPSTAGNGNRHDT